MSRKTLRRAPATVSVPVRSPAAIGIRLIVSVILAAVVTRIAYAMYPNYLSVKTNVVGYPTWANFNVDRYIHIYLMGVVVLPLAALVFYQAISMVERRIRKPGTRRVPFSRAIALDPGPEALPARKVAVIGTLRGWLVGFVLGIEFADWTRTASHTAFWLLALAVSFIYLGLLAAVGSALESRGALGGRWDRWDLQAAINAAFSPLTVLGLYAISSVTTVSVASPPSVVHYPWLPLWLALPVAAALECWVIAALRSRLRAGTSTREVEFGAVARIAGCVMVFLVVARMTGALGGVDFFAGGENLGGANLLLNHAFPWRDYFFIHGPLQDIVYAAVGLGVFQFSAWGAAAGQSVWILPIGWVCFYLANTYLFRRSWPLILLIPWFVGGPDIGFRFAGIPLVTALFAIYLAKPRPWLGVVFGISVVVMVILTPEIVFFAGLIGLVLIARDIFYRQPGRVWESYQRTAWAAVGVVGGGAAWGLYLATNRALGPFFEYFLVFGPGHRLAGGIPMALISGSWKVAAAAPIVATFGIFLYFVSQLRRRRPLAPVDWAMAALGLFAVYYYTKFLDRADGHIFESLAVALPVIGYVAWRGCQEVEEALRRRPGGRRLLTKTTDHPAALACLVAMLVGLSALATPTYSYISGMPGAFAASAPTPSTEYRLGYLQPAAVNTAALDDVEQVLDAVVGPHGGVFDFTDSPGLFNFVENRPSPTRYYDVAMAEPAFSQKQLDDELATSKPSIVVYNGPVGLPTWDMVPAQVRHYEVSDYLLSHYHPFVSVDNFFLLLRNSVDLPATWSAGLHLSQPLITTGLAFDESACDWGYVPNFLQVPSPPSEAGAATLGLAQMSPTSLQLDLPSSPLTSYHWLEVDSSKGLSADRFVVSDGTPSSSHDIDFNTVGRSNTKTLVEVGSCLQWHSYQTSTLTLTFHSPENITAVKLLS
ncbi:MAG TPA: hypothetical protein VKY26_03630 [Actinomycetota bacterium]|nr:hypothetical protein [Actinomycetota bacterium]